MAFPFEGSFGLDDCEARLRHLKVDRGAALRDNGELHIARIVDMAPEVCERGFVVNDGQDVVFRHHDLQQG